MFVFGDEDSSARRFGPVTLGVLALVVALSVAAALWHPERGSETAAPTPAGSLDPLAVCRQNVQDAGLSISLYDSAEPLDARKLVEGKLRWEAQHCGPLVADDPDRLQLADPWLVTAKAEQINTGVDRAICPDPAACTQARQKSGEDVSKVRAALDGLGYPAAEVRLPEPADGVPLSSVLYGVPLDQSACLVAYARIGEGTVHLPPVGRLTSGTCLRP
ncbi:hypothetical protein Aab01nite_09420 [Paractinoplanes abujensis]|uniref:Uncharacterized protein n=1 Tax=Paractinoplanes abujensis TaxID=882441 RepID=A0A7W7CMF3_9ACTN|nr:hypothetical protein [Actinoplanes abujensis]MBB4691231.1 hypothetical protein [Actinoplanes abujensis]GID17352.1 hypothetical protein Aab01nite_09420 [Actinoplanes abujensis]